MDNPPATILGEMPSTAPLQDDWKKKANAGGYRVNWGAAYRLECLSNGRDLVFPQLGAGRLVPGATLPRPIILIGEEAAGESSLMFWLQARQAAQSASAKPGGASPRSRAGHAAAASPSPKVQTFDLAQFRGDRLEDLIAFLTHHDRNCVDLVSFLRKHLNNTLVVYMRLDHLNPVIGSSLLGSLRRAFESATRETSLDGVKLVLMGRDERAFDTEPYSAIADVAEVCRLPRFSREEVSLLLVRHWGDAAPGRFDAQALEVQRITGGQPLLTQMLLQQLERNAPERFDANRVYRQLRDNPPVALIAWRKRLARMIQHDELMRAAVRDLLGGREYPIDTDLTHLRAPYFLRSLSLSGWLSPGLDAAGKTAVWRFSDLHRFWAGPVLREPAEFLDGHKKAGRFEETGR